MTLIQPLLVFGLLLLTLVYLTSARSIVFDRIVVLTAAGIGVLCIIFPELSISAAHMLGVGRGVDLIFYCFMLFAGFVMLILSRTIAKQQHRLTQLVRLLAITEAERTLDSIQQTSTKSEASTKSCET
jgi:small membrane protein